MVCFFVRSCWIWTSVFVGCWRLVNCDFCPTDYPPLREVDPRQCQLCPGIYCFITENVDKPTDNVMSCATREGLPLAGKVRIHLVCVLVNDKASNLSQLYIYNPVLPEKVEHHATCVNQNFLNWLQEKSIYLKTLELGFTVLDLPPLSILIQYREPLKYMRHLCIQTESDLYKDSLARVTGTLDELEITLISHSKLCHQRSVTPNEHVEGCHIRRSQILRMTKSCHLNTSHPKLPQFPNNEEALQHKPIHCQPSSCRYQQEEVPVPENHEMPTLALRLSLFLLLILIIVGSIITHYIRNHSKYSPQKRQERLEKKRALDDFLRNSFQTGAYAQATLQQPQIVVSKVVAGPSSSTTTAQLAPPAHHQTSKK